MAMYMTDLIYDGEFEIELNGEWRTFIGSIFVDFGEDYHNIIAAQGELFDENGENPVEIDVTSGPIFAAIDKVTYNSDPIIEKIREVEYDRKYKPDAWKDDY